MKYLIILALVLSISGCQSVEEASRWDASTLLDHKKIFVECRGKVFAFREWINKKKEVLTSEERSTKIIRVQSKCLEEKLGVVLYEQTPTTHLDISSRTTLRFYTGGDHTLLKYFERSRKWHRIIRENGEPWKGFWLEHNKVIDKWRKVYKAAN